MDINLSDCCQLCFGHVCFVHVLLEPSSRLLAGLSEKLKNSIHSGSASRGQFYDLRLLFLLTALRPELRRQLQQVRPLQGAEFTQTLLRIGRFLFRFQERGVSMLTVVLEQCLEVRPVDLYEAAIEPASPPICKESSQRAIEVLKVLFNITYSLHRQQPDQVGFTRITDGPKSTFHWCHSR